MSEAATQGSAALRSRLVDANGLTFEIFEQRPRSSQDPEHLVLFLHGFPEHAMAWRHQLPVVAERGDLAWAMNLRGYGRSSRPPRVNDYAIEHLLTDVAAVIDASGARRVTLVGHDWGAVIAWYFAIREMRPLERLVIMNVPHPAPMARELRANRAQRKRSWYAYFFQLPVLPEKLLGRGAAEPVARMFSEGTVNPGRVSAEEAEVFAANARQPGALRAMIHYYRALGLGGGAKRQSAMGFPMIDVPTLLIWGEQDVALCKETTFGTEAWVRQLTLRYLPNASHWVQQDEPELVNTMLAAFLDGDVVPHADGAQGDLDPPSA